MKFSFFFFTKYNVHDKVYSVIYSHVSKHCHCIKVLVLKYYINCFYGTL